MKPMFSPLFKKNTIVFAVILLIHQFIFFFVFGALYPIHFAQENFLILELIGITKYIPSGALFLIDSWNLSIMWLISERIFNRRLFFIPIIIYAISPWTIYLMVAGSFYIYLLFLLLTIFYGLLLINSNRLLLGSVFTIVGTLAAFYSSYILFLLLPIVFILIVIFKMIPLNKLKATFILVIIFTCPLLFLIFTHQVAFKNIMNNEVKVFDDPGLINTVNTYQGAVRGKVLGKFAKISENKYLFLTENIMFKYIDQLVPLTYLTQQDKLLSFSFNPPILLGFLIPLTFGLYEIMKIIHLRKILFLSTLLVIPSVLSEQMVDLNRLILFAPSIILIISYGLIGLLKQRRKKGAVFVLLITLFLVVLQLFIILSDIQLREKDRFLKYFSLEKHYEIGKQ